MVQGVSRESLAAGQERLAALLSVPGTDPARVGEELLGVTDVLASSAGLRRALTDPSRDGEAKAGLVTQLLGSRIGSTTADFVAGLARARWSRPADLTDAVESFGVSAVLAGAEQAGRLDAVEDELFRFSRTVAGDNSLRDAFSARTAGADRKAQLVRTLLAGKAAPETVRLAVQAATAPRGQRTEAVLEGYVEAAAQRRRQLVAEVTSAAPLTQVQRDRLAAALQRLYGREIRINADVDPSVVGGLRVQVGGELIDGTVVGRLDEARRRMAG
ncbi:F0F1 ATP synthase subunit delta [Kineosporia sp. R_H_3]|uniref:F0F1 ATP synthase subunit delta n=1 Tax=Kineosporia sp. R_H_3 TaxID=1961848 RepID=UPI000B4BA002|nr:F0F1 ATP synthase subunit delta [Kineosporia sp. R_H_3]